ncbi:MAG: TdeIII family type II restriction endonuclease, partial [Gammaproteobacteria bacterium]
SIKTVKPNIDQTAEAKRDLLKLKLHDPDSNVYFGLYYNPYGDHRDDYSWGPPMGIFDFHSDPSVLIGSDYWDVLGGEGFYAEILDIAGTVGNECRQMLENL